MSASEPDFTQHSLRSLRQPFAKTVMEVSVTVMDAVRTRYRPLQIPPHNMQTTKLLQLSSPWSPLARAPTPRKHDPDSPLPFLATSGRVVGASSLQGAQTCCDVTRRTPTCPSASPPGRACICLFHFPLVPRYRCYFQM